MTVYDLEAAKQALHDAELRELSLAAELAALKAAGAPADEAAEREHCRRATALLVARQGAYYTPAMLVERERAAVRAEMTERLRHATDRAERNDAEVKRLWGSCAVYGRRWPRPARSCMT